MGARSWTALVLVLVAIGLGLFAFDFPRPSSNDMAPSIRKGDLLLACRVCGRPERGDVVLFAPVEGGPSLQIRRVAAVPGDQVEVREGHLWVNGQPLSRPEEVGTITLSDPRTGHPQGFSSALETNGGHKYHTIRDPNVRSLTTRRPTKLRDTYFLLADQRTRVRDSRDYGPVPSASVRALVLRVLSPGDHDRRRRAPIP